MNKLNQLSEILEKTKTKEEFNIVEDLENLERIFGAVKSKDFRRKLNALIDKYKNNELTEIRNALLEKCRNGDINAIKLYLDYFKPVTVVDADDGLIEALSGAGAEVWKDEV